MKNTIPLLFFDAFDYLVCSMSKVAQREHLPQAWLSDANRTDDVEEMFDVLVECNDVLLERASTTLDQIAGLVKKERLVEPQGGRGRTASVASWNKTKGIFRANTVPGRSSSFPQSKNIPKPQKDFMDIIDNSNNPFVPLLRNKPNAKRPLSDILPWLDQDAPSDVDGLISSIKHQVAPPKNARYGHPYEFEIQSFQPNTSQFENAEPIPPRPLDETPLIFVDTEEKLVALTEDLKGTRLFAADLEHHSYRTFLGLVCLLQISTREKDYLVDTIKLRRHMNMLNDPFTDPNIVKVLHGADWDILWLQRDFGIYVVNLFDTFFASKTLGLSRHSLAHLLKHYCSVEADKQYQLADWRVRPLPEEMVKYAREDTHYLLFIYDTMKNDLLQRGNKRNNLMQSVIDRSREVCLKKYEKPIHNDGSYIELYKKKIGRTPFNSHQLEAFRLLFQWRSKVAREEDESPAYVLPSHMLVQIAYTLPREPQGILACCTPVPPLLRANLSDVHSCVLEAVKVEFVLNPMVSCEQPMESGVSETSGEVNDYRTESTSSRRRRPSTSQQLSSIEGPPVVLRDYSSMLPSLKSHQSSDDVREKLKEIRLSFDNPLEQFCTPSPTPPPLLMGLVTSRNSQPSQHPAHLRSLSVPSVPTPSANVISLSTRLERHQTERLTSGVGESGEDGVGESGEDGESEDEEGEDSSVDDRNMDHQSRRLSRSNVSEKRRKKMKAPLRDQMKSSKRVFKRQRNVVEGNESGEEATQSMKKKGKHTAILPEDFQPYDYSSKTFSEVATQGTNKMYFDPRKTDVNLRKNKTSVPKSRVHQRSGQRSATYNPRRVH